ncbi:UbiA family prenyltransferase [Polyangium jinanense]|uniref:UbiA prenyltransferase family protein n=1 Tax=Polyangium jinanense TaxID=2829994 RepID=A0A9X3X014_9BACT|nr:UbiA family prenyltransferase [Polyangium jinanense]MDC3955281.1 UbiA prenyltransferase family protein [Polyangium jinanense]MDC3981582.1 UbiA prenyltransferase family protein [Polyangium jinanense]
MNQFATGTRPFLGTLRLSRVEEFYGNTIALVALGTIFNPRLSAGDIVLLFTGNLLLTIFAFAINDVEDAEDDSKDSQKVVRNPICAHLLTPGQALALSWLSAFAGLALLWPFGARVVLLGALNVALGFLYSYRRIRLKAVPFVDLVSHGLFLGTLQFLTVAYARAPELPPSAALGAVFICTISMAGDLWNEIRDFEVDRETGIRNTASLFDVRRIEPILPHLFVWPSMGVASLVLLSLSGTQRLIVGLAVAVLCLVFVLLPSSLKKRMVTDQAQWLAALAGLLLLVICRVTSAAP